MPSKLDVSDFRTERVTFEGRYGSSYFLWDAAGAIATDLTDRLPGLTLKEADPGTVSFEMPKQFAIRIELRRMVVVLLGAQAISQVAKLADCVFRVVANRLRVSLFDRLGLRFQCFREFDSRAASVPMLLSTGLLKLPEEKVFGADNGVSSAEVAITFSGKALGGTFKLSSQTRSLNVELPPEFPAPDNMKLRMEGLLLDVDLFTPKPVPTSMLGLSEWIEQGIHVFKRDVPKLLG